MRIVHFSDIHIGRLTQDPSALLDKRLLGMVNYFLRRQGHMNEELIRLAVSRVRALKADIVICTGDLTCVGSPEEFAAAHGLLKPMREARSQEFFAIPGNHDLYVSNPRCQAAFRETFSQLNPDALRVDSLPLEIRRGGLRLLFVNEALPRLPWSSGGRLPLLSRQWLRHQTAGAPEPAERRILVGHFPVRNGKGGNLSRRRRLDDGGVIAELLDSGALGMALCGHIHDPFRRDEPSGAMEVCAGSLPLTGRLNVVDYCPVSGELIQHWDNVTGVAGSAAGVTRQLVAAEAAACR